MKDLFVDTSAWYPLADAGSFAVMSELGIREALTLDHHFTVAGYVILPASG